MNLSSADREVDGADRAADGAAEAGERGEGSEDRAAEGVAEAVESDEDIVYEQDILRDPGNMKYWLAYADFKLQHGTVRERAFVLEREDSRGEEARMEKQME